MEGQRSSSSLFGVPTCLFILLVALTGCIPETKSEEHRVGDLEGDQGPYNCMHLVMRAAKSVVKVLSGCTKKVKATTKNNIEFGDKMGCVMKCALHDANITTPDYYITRESLLPLMRKMIKNQYMVHELHEFLTHSCENAAAQLNPDEEKCLSYSDYVACLLSTFEEFMNTSPHCIKRKKKESTETNMEISIG